MKSSFLATAACLLMLTTSAVPWPDQYKNHNYFQDGMNEIRDSTVPIGVLELRNYVIKKGMRDSFISYFEENLVQPQNDLKGYVLGQYRVKSAPDNFCWLRGFSSMRARSTFLPAFYYGPVWKQHRNTANSMLANNDNVYLLHPLVLKKDSLDEVTSIDHSLLIPHEGIAVIEFYISNTRLPELLQVFAKEYLPVWKDCAIDQYTLWTCVLEENDFPRLPVFQDKNLLLSITFYKNENDYEESQKKLEEKISADLRAKLQDVITIKNTMIVYPTPKTVDQKR